MGYGKRAMKLLKDYYEGKTANLQENAGADENRKHIHFNI